MSFQTRESVITELRAIFPPGTRVHAVAFDSRLNTHGLTRTSIAVFAHGENISDAVSIALNDRFISRPIPATRGTYGGLSPALQLISELSRTLHGSSTALSLSTPQAAPRNTSRARIR